MNIALITGMVAGACWAYIMRRSLLVHGPLNAVFFGVLVASAGGLLAITLELVFDLFIDTRIIAIISGVMLSIAPLYGVFLIVRHAPPKSAAVSMSRLVTPRRQYTALMLGFLSMETLWFVPQLWLVGLYLPLSVALFAYGAAGETLLMRVPGWAGYYRNVYATYAPPPPPPPNNHTYEYAQYSRTAYAPPAEIRQCYTLLGVDESADLNTVKAAYRRLARVYHPDLNNNADAHEHMQRINVAYRLVTHYLSENGRG